MDQAERILAERRWFMATEAQYDEFLRLIDEPLPSTEKFDALWSRPSPVRSTPPAEGAMTDGILQSPRKLARDDDRGTFTSEAPELNDWFWRFAWENQRASNAVTYVTTCDDVVLGYYALALSAYAKSQLPERMQKNRPVQTPCLLLARLAVDTTAQDQGVGAALLRHAIEQAYHASQSVGAAALLIHCRDDVARSFYLRNGDFIASPPEPPHLVLPMKEISRRLS